MNRNAFHALTGHVVLAVASWFMLLQTEVLTGRAITTTYKIILPLATFCVYRIAYAGLWPLRKKLFLRHPEIIISILIVLLLSAYLPVEQLAVMIILGITSLLYFTPVRSWKGMRSVLFLKSVWVALTWTIATIPLILLRDVSLQTIIERFLFMLSICIIYNIRDIEEDTIKGFKTIPLHIGIIKTRILVIALLIADAVLICFNTYSINAKGALIVSLLATIIAVIFAKKEGKFYYSIYIDAMMILQSMLVLLVA